MGGNMGWERSITGHVSQTPNIAPRSSAYLRIDNFGN